MPSWPPLARCSRPEFSDASEALPPERSIGNWLMPRKKCFITQPTTPLPVKYSLLARKLMGRLTATGRKTESTNDRWLLAKITAPDDGTFSSPRVQGRNTEFANGPTMKVFKNQ